MGFQDHLVHQDLKDVQDHKELKVKLLSNMNLAFQRSMFHYKDSITIVHNDILDFFFFSGDPGVPGISASSRGIEMQNNHP